MFDLKYEDRLQIWHDLRQSLETSNDPILDVISFYNQSPRVSIHTDPYDEKCWPDPWQLLYENQYCDFCIVLGQCYSLQLTERFSASQFEIHIGIDTEKSRTLYLLIIDNNTVLGWNDSYVLYKDLPKSFKTEKIHTLTNLH